MEKKNNYLASRDKAKKYFLGFDADAICKKWELACDSEYIYLTFFGIDYKVSKTDGSIFKLENDGLSSDEAGFNITLTIFDLLCHTAERPRAAGKFAAVNSLPGKPVSVGVGTGDFHGKYAEIIDKNPAAFHKACRKMGGKEISLGDICYEFTLFKDLKIRIKFYHADEDFPANIICLWDENTLSYMFYETTFYAVGCIMDMLMGM